jgi:transcriptional regulator with XRE-family HTH domain
MQPEVRNRIAGEVRAAMARSQKTQRDLAEVLGIDQPSVSLRLRGERSFRAEELAVVAEWLGVPAADLLEPAA